MNKKKINFKEKISIHLIKYQDIAKNCLLFFVINLFTISFVKAQYSFAKWTDSELILNNGFVQRNIKLPSASGSVGTTSYKPVVGIFKYFEKNNPEFQFEINDKIYAGKGNWTLIGIQKITDTKQGDGAAVTILSEDKQVELTLKYLLYPNLPVIRKSLVIKNLSDKSVSLESVDIEKFNVTGYYATTFSWICHDYGRRRSIGPYDGNMQDALLTVHNSDWQQGIVIGNEAAGVIKHTSVFWQEPTICSGLTHKDSRFPFRKHIQQGQSFETPQVFTMVYNNHKDPDEILNTAVPDFVRRHVGIRLSELSQKPTFIYNTWVPFRKDINEKLVMELAKSAADAGMKEFIIDDGWNDNYGDWMIDKKKFPNGLKPVFDYIKSLGMKPGLWVSVGSASPDSKVYKEHPEWFVLDQNLNPANLHEDDLKMRTACFSTDWYNYIKNVLMKLSLEYGLEYLKLDFTVVTSPYRFGKENTGCYAKNHQHKDQHESFYMNYENVWRLFDELHAAKPNLFIDCTLETMGGLQLIDYAMLKHAEGDWLSNFYGPPDENVDLKVRNMAWWRSPAIPATALVIGNPEMQDVGWEMHIKSLAGALPIMLGDPRKLSTPDFKKYRSYADWLQAMENKHQIMSFRQDLAGFGEPKEGLWDGFQRINTDTKSGGIIGVFKHGSLETERLVTLKYLNPERNYIIKEAISGKKIIQATGKQLSETGFKVKINEQYNGQLFEITVF
ncbi:MULTISPECIES: alpha-galactosidase [unclassified Arcicella]|uniref:alpha-galactosidase n=1 Tax=unclassified Arcicella TaxID=2644986 RepID=UPI0028562E99|nr:MULTISPECIES: alpha-galactosidase [unclassified Arcicella]MDR6562291.1 alpha-galactosidase [Arcicella sp. BE51]MDR6812014.1 alpha-galactosidase [Arcicella sp. BE140]MDR6823325.1 alpha-galactosidase [Arcicella sp. BE139]